MCFAAPVLAQSANLGGELALSSQLVDRGLAITPATPVLQGAVSWASPSGWSVGLAGGTEMRSPGRPVEMQARVSHAWSLSDDWQIQASLLHSYYHGQDGSRAFHRTEMDVGWTYRDIVTFGLAAVWLAGSDDHQPKGAADLNVRWPLTRHLSLAAGAGFAQSTLMPYSAYRPVDVDHYRYGQLGLVWNDGPWRVEFDRIRTSADAQRQWGNLRTMPWLLTVSRSFPL